MSSFNFTRGHPNKHLVPVQEMKALLTQIGSSSDEDALCKSLNYGDEEGQADFRNELASFLHRQCALDQGPMHSNNSLFITGGVSHGIELLCSVATQPGDVVWVETPTYFLAADIFKSHGLVVESLPMLTAGVIDMSVLRERLLSTCTPPRIIYVIPTHQNPTAQTMSLDDRGQLARLAEEYNILIIADEVYHLLDYSNVDNKTMRHDRPARMVMFNGGDNKVRANDSTGSSSITAIESSDSPRPLLSGCCSVSSFTKIFGPGVRLGWIEGPAPVVGALKEYGYIVSQGGVAPFMGFLFLRALQQRVCDDVLNNLCRAYSHRVDVLMRILEQEARIDIPCRPRGGYFLWLVLPFDSAAFLKYCEPDLTFLSGSKCCAAPQGSLEDACPMNLEIPRSLRLCFAYLDLDCLTAAVYLFVSKFRSYANRLKSEGNGS